MDKVQANFRLDSAAKQEAYAVLHKIGIKPTDAVNMFMHHIAMFGELPFRPKIPNAETLKTFAETDAGIGLLPPVEDVDAYFANIEAEVEAEQL